jgi:DNA polymerase-3 subunit beta
MGGIMEFKILKEPFLKALQKVQGIVEKKNTMPILSNVLIEAADGAIWILATDLEVGIKTSHPATVISEGKITVSAKKLYEIIKELSDEELTFSTRENDWVELRSGKAQFNIVGLSSDEFPYFPRINEENLIRVSCSLLNDMIEKTAYAICHDETKYNLNGVFMKAVEESGKNILRMVATDGHRLAVVEREFSGQVCQELKSGAIFPKKGIFELKKMTEDADEDLLMTFQDNSAILKKGDTIVVMRLVDGEFPDYSRVIPVSNDLQIIIEKESFLRALKRIAILSSEKFKGVKFSFTPDKLEISSSNPEIGDAKEELDTVYSGTLLETRFNARYIIDVLSVLKEDSVQILLKSEMSPAIIKPMVDQGFQAVIMPMRL